MNHRFTGNETIKFFYLPSWRPGHWPDWLLDLLVGAPRLRPCGRAPGSCGRRPGGRAACGRAGTCGLRPAAPVLGLPTRRTAPGRLRPAARSAGRAPSSCGLRPGGRAPGSCGRRPGGRAACGRAGTCGQRLPCLACRAPPPPVCPPSAAAPANPPEPRCAGRLDVDGLG